MEETDIVIVGGGPSGLALSVALSHQHIKNIILEMNEEICEDPRAIAITGDTCRILRLCGVSDDALTRIGQAAPHLNFHYGTFTDTPFLSLDQRRDWLGQAMPLGVMIFQPKLEQTLREFIASSSFSELRTKCRVMAREELENAVEVSYEDHDHKTRLIRSRFLIGADGKKGVVRKHFLESRGIKQETGVEHYSGMWIAANLKINTPTPNSHPDFPLWKHGYTEAEVFDIFWPPGFHFCNDPISPIATGRFGALDPKYWRHGRRPATEAVVFPWDCVEVIRCQPAFFVHKVVNRWFDQRTILIGDAAHVFPPFGGQGIANGIRDAHGLAWRLSLILKMRNNHNSQPCIDRRLNEWSRERREGVNQASRITMRNGNLLNNKSWVISRLYSWASAMLDYVPGLKTHLLGMAFSDAEGYTHVEKGFFLPSHGGSGGGKMAQIWLRAKDSSLIPSDKLFWNADAFLTVLVVGDTLTISGCDGLKQTIVDANIPQHVLASEIVAITFSQPAGGTATHEEVPGCSQFTACLNSEIDDAGISVPLGYDRMAMGKRFKRDTRFVLVRPDFIIFSQASSLNELGTQLVEVKRMLLN